MKTIFIGIFILAFLAGITAKTIGSGQTSFVGYFLNIIGYKQKEELGKEQMSNIFNQSKIDTDQIDKYLKEQQSYLENSRLKMNSLSQIIRDLKQTDAADLLRLKDLLRDFEDHQNVLLVKNGSYLLKLNESQKKINQKMKMQLEASSRIIDSNQIRFIENFRDNLDRQKELMNNQFEDNRVISDRIKQVREQINQFNDHTPAEQVAKIKEKLRTISDQTIARMDSLKEKQERLKNLNDRNSNSINALKQKIEDLKYRSDSSLQRSKMNDQSRKLNDRVRDQIERARERSHR